VGYLIPIMSEQPKLKAGENIVSMCPICKVGFEDPMPTNQKMECPNPECRKEFLVMVY